MTNTELPFEQIGLFRHRFPDGFRGQAWQLTVRTQQRLPVVRQAAQLAERVLGTLAQDLDCGDVVRELCEVLARSRLVPTGEIASLLCMSSHHEAALCGQLARLLFGVDPFAERFDRWVGVLRGCLRREPSWQLATAPLALIKPDWYVCVQPAMFRRQAAAFTGGLVPHSEPGARAYEQYNAMAHAIADSLRAAGLEPTDMFDLYDFIVETLPSSFAEGSGDRSGILERD